MINPSIPFSSPTRVILVRHGRSTYNEQGRYQGASDESVLTEKGHQDARQTGLVLGETTVSAIYTSPLQRTQQTAQAIQSAWRTSLPIMAHPDLKEIDLPAWAGLRYQYVRESLTADYQRWINAPHQFEMIGPHGVRRPVQDLYHQAQRFWRQILPRHAGQTLLIVSHGGTIRALLGTALGLSCRHYHTLQQSNCGISMLRFPNHASLARLESMNDTSHLGEALPKLKAGRQGLRLLMVPSGENDFQSVQPLRLLLRAQKLDFCVSQSDAAQMLCKAILAEHPQTIQLHTNRTDFHHLWLQTLNNRQIQTQSGEILTGVLVAQSQILQQMLSHMIGAHQGFHFPLIGGRVSVVHCPTTQLTPILQSMNFTGPAAIQRGLVSCIS
ncbi:histidine phosphatase family protein [Acaryochloris sp. IP29b_bin.137]|uniref:histidine phosphatase family protein n=1 Tax=Acaryochloris sp. IP29b_bin.137 TaxID=2969217 RepID=UPI00262C7E52|nr:histidine phosphatase family protein [Acaryochloris sp. IP29b_bin.137]